MLEQLKEACGVFAAKDYDNKPVFPYVYWGLRAQNHRGHQSHGFLTFDGKFHSNKGLDLVPKIKKEEIQKWLNKLPGTTGLGHVRYSTSGGTDYESLVKSTQPILEKRGDRQVAIAFNGNIVNTPDIIKEIQQEYPNFHFNYDAELISRKLLRKEKSKIIYPEEGYCTGLLFDAYVKGIKCAVVAPKIEDYPRSVLELIAAMNLRKTLKLEDGDTVSVLVKI